MWTANQISILRRGYLTELLEGNALRRWCGGRGLIKTDSEIDKQLKELNYFIPKDDDETLKAERSRLLVAAAKERRDREEKAMAPRREALAREALAREIALAKAEAASAPLFRMSVKEQEHWARREG